MQNFFVKVGLAKYTYATISQTIIIKTKSSEIYYFFRNTNSVDKWITFKIKKLKNY